MFDRVRHDRGDRLPRLDPVGDQTMGERGGALVEFVAGQLVLTAAGATTDEDDLIGALDRQLMCRGPRSEEFVAHRHLP